MTFLLAVREKLVEIYGKFSVYIDPLIKFIFAVIAMIIINSNIGYMAKLKNPMVVIVVGIVCALFPNAVTVVMIGVVMLAHLYELSLEMFIVAACVMLLMYLLYFRFTANSSIWVVITLLLCIMKVPYMTPVVAALAGGMFTIVPVSMGVVIYYIVKFASDYAVAITAENGATDLMQKFSFVISGIFNSSLTLIIVCFAVTIAIVAIVKKLAIDNSWIISIVIGTLTNFVLLLMGNVIMSSGLNIVSIIISSVLAIVIGYLLAILLFSVDYSRTERVSYEDDDYVYYVKAVPKCSVSAADVKVKRINSQRNSRKKDNDDIDSDIDLD